MSDIRFRAVLLEDNDAIRKALRETLANRGYEIFSFTSPAICPMQLEPECRCKGGQRCVDIIISDLDMPTITGLQFIENQKRKNCKCQHIALMSGFWTEEDELQAKKFGCKVFSKPFDLFELNQWLDRVERQISPTRKLTNWFQDQDTLS